MPATPHPAFARLFFLHPTLAVAAPPVGGEGSSLCFHRFATGKTEKLLSIRQIVMWGFAVSPDSRSVLHTQTDGLTGDLMLVENFR